MTIAYSGDNITFPDASVQNTAPKAGMVNRIINGDMRIDQRNAGASVTPADGQYLVDRWAGMQAVASKYSAQRNAGSVAPPAGFSNYLGATSLSAYSVGATDYFGFRQSIEGFNTADLAWGTANAQSITLSFWVRSSLTGTFGGALQNAASNRFYAFSYTISAVNTWEKKTVVVAGDTSGTWATENTAGLRLTFGLGVGSTYSVAAGSWGSSAAISATGATSVVGTSGATFYITGVQLEKGSTATDFDYRPYELALCQRYYQKSYPQATVPGTSIVHTSGGCQNFWWAASASSTIGGGGTALPVAMRTQPTVVIYDMAGTSGVVSGHSSGGTLTNGVALNQTYATENNVFARVYNVSYVGISYAYTLTAEL